MQFRSHSDGSSFPITPRKSMDLSSVRAQKGTWTRTITKKHLSKLRTLENPLLWSNFLKNYEPLNQDFDFENEVDRTLEPEEALNEIKKRHPHFDAGDKEKGSQYRAAFREDLENRGIDNTKVQNLIVQDLNPLTEEEISKVAGALPTRSAHAVIV